MTRPSDDRDLPGAGPQASFPSFRELPLLLNAEQAAQLLAISRAHLYELMRSGEIPIVRLGRSTRIPADALRDWVACRQQRWTGEPWTDV